MKKKQVKRFRGFIEENRKGISRSSGIEIIKLVR